jgi:hypothetical protein
LVDGCTVSWLAHPTALDPGTCSQYMYTPAGLSNRSLRTCRRLLRTTPIIHVPVPKPRQAQCKSPPGFGACSIFRLAFHLIRPGWEFLLGPYVVTCFPTPQIHLSTTQHNGRSAMAMFCTTTFIQLHPTYDGSSTITAIRLKARPSSERSGSITPSDPPANHRTGGRSPSNRIPAALQTCCQ